MDHNTAMQTVHDMPSMTPRSLDASASPSEAPQLPRPITPQPMSVETPNTQPSRPSRQRVQADAWPLDPRFEARLIQYEEDIAVLNAMAQEIMEIQDMEEDQDRRWGVCLRDSREALQRHPRDTSNPQIRIEARYKAWYEELDRIRDMLQDHFGHSVTDRDDSDGSTQTVIIPPRIEIPLLADASTFFRLDAIIRALR
jgi:hypothetical protein